MKTKKQMSLFIGMIKSVIPSYARLPLAISLLFNLFVYNGARLIAGGWHHYNLESALDRRIPFLPWTVSIYVASYLFWAVSYILCVRTDIECAYRFLSADLLAKCFCLFFFLLLPTTNTRPEILGSGFWHTAIKLLYQIDDADNLFPSIHCLVSQLCCIGIRRRKEIPLWYRIFTHLMAISIFLSTLTTKQHVIVDVIGGILIAEFCYWYIGRSGLAARYQKILN